MLVRLIIQSSYGVCDACCLCVPANSTDTERCFTRASHVTRVQAYMWTKHSTDLAKRLFRVSDERLEARWAARHEWAGERVYRMVSQVRPRERMCAC